MKRQRHFKSSSEGNRKAFPVKTASPGVGALGRLSPSCPMNSVLSGAESCPESCLLFFREKVFSRKYRAARFFPAGNSGREICFRFLCRNPFFKLCPNQGDPFAKRCRIGGPQCTHIESKSFAVFLFKALQRFFRPEITAGAYITVDRKTVRQKLVPTEQALVVTSLCTPQRVFTPFDFRAQLIRHF